MLARYQSQGVSFDLFLVDICMQMSGISFPLELNSVLCAAESSGLLLPTVKSVTPSTFCRHKYRFRHDSTGP